MENKDIDILIKELKIFNCEWIYALESFYLNLDDDESIGKIEVAFFSTNRINKFKLFEKAQEISSKLGREVDLNDLKDSSIDFQYDVTTQWNVIFDNNSSKREEFELDILSRYIDGQLASQEILDQENRFNDLFFNEQDENNDSK